MNTFVSPQMLGLYERFAADPTFAALCALRTRLERCSAGAIRAVGMHPVLLSSDCSRPLSHDTLWVVGRFGGCDSVLRWHAVGCLPIEGLQAGGLHVVRGISGGALWVSERAKRRGNTSLISVFG